MNLTQPIGDGVMQRLPPGLKLAALFALSMLLFFFTAPSHLGIAAGMVLLGSLLASRDAVVAWLRSWPLLLTIVIVAIWTAYASGFEAAAVVLMRLGALSLFATLVTTTTTAGQFIETITRLAGPLERVGLANARDIGLAMGLVMRFIPDVRARYRAIADAHRARSLKMGFTTLLVPMLIGTLKSADEIADAIDARGIRSQRTGQEGL
jgi:biotin transport system permease protein